MTIFRDMVQMSGDGQSTADVIPQTGKLGARDGEFTRNAREIRVIVPLSRPF